MNEIDRLVIATAMRTMFEKPYFDICTVDQCLKVAGVVAPRKTYERLRALHCISFAAMPRELLEAIPGMVRECFDGVNIEALIAAAEPAKVGARVSLLRG